MIHEIKVKEKYYNLIEKQEKIYEVRLLDNKRKLIKKSDLIKIYKEPDLKEFLILKVEDLLHFKTFEQMALALPAKEVGFEGCSKEEVVAAYHQFYTEEMEQKFGVVAIKLTPIIN